MFRFQVNNFFIYQVALTPHNYHDAFSMAGDGGAVHEKWVWLLGSSLLAVRNPTLLLSVLGDQDWSWRYDVEKQIVAALFCFLLEFYFLVFG